MLNTNEIAKEIFIKQIKLSQTPTERIAICRDESGYYLIELNSNETNKNEIQSFPVYSEIDFLWQDYAYWENGQLVIPSEDNQVVEDMNAFINECIQLGDWEDSLFEISEQLSNLRR